MISYFVYFIVLQVLERNAVRGIFICFIFLLKRILAAIRTAIFKVLLGHWLRHWWRHGASVWRVLDLARVL